MSLTTGLKLLLSGYEEQGKNSEPYPVTLPGESTVLSSHDIGSYYNEQFYYYYEFYMKCKRCGLPYDGGWAELPRWVLMLICRFDTAVEEVTNYLNHRSKSRGE